VRGRSLKVAQLIVERLGFRNKRRGPHERLPARARFGEPHRDGHEVLGEYDARDVVGRAIQHGQPAVLALPEGLEDFVGGRRHVDSGHVESRRHDLVHRRIRQREDPEQHVALGNAQIGLQRARRVHEGVQPAISPREQPEQRTERSERAAGEGERRVGELRGNARHTARQGVAHDEQQQCSHDQDDERFGPRPGPPRHRVGRGHGAQHEQREARHVQRAMQRHTSLGGDGWRIAQGMERLAYSGFFRQGEQRGPCTRGDGDDKPDDAQCRFGEH